MSKFSLGFFDQLFGTKVTMEVPDGNGNIVKRNVSKKWFDKMVAEGQMRILDNTVTVNILDPTYDEPYQTTWIIGEDIDQEYVDKFLDAETNSLHVLIAYEEGEQKVMTVTRDFFNQAVKQLESV